MHVARTAVRLVVAPDPSGGHLFRCLHALGHAAVTECRDQHVLQGRPGIRRIPLLARGVQRCRNTCVEVQNLMITTHV